ncbi:cytochrome P450 [Aspergillus oleicola]
MTRQRKKLDLQCGFCPKRYTKREHLQRHKRTHTGSKPYPCPICGRCFSRQDVLNRHLRVHSQADGSQASDAGQWITPQIQSVPSDWPSMSDHDATQFPETNCLPVYETLMEEPRPLPADLASGLLWPAQRSCYTISCQSTPVYGNSRWRWHLRRWECLIHRELMGGTFQDSPGSSTIADDGRQTIQSLSSLISDTFLRVTAPTSLTGLTSRFLDGSLHMFFENIIPLFPIFHRPTFVFRDCGPPLLLNAIALGALFRGSEDAIAKADVLWCLAHTAVATSWHTMITRKRPGDCCTGVELVQTVLLDQIYAALSKNRTFRTTSQVFHGLGIHWASHCGMYDAAQAVAVPNVMESPATKHEAWHRWIAQETMIRTLLGLYIVDGVVSQFSGNPTFARHTANPLLPPSGDAAFAALAADDWIQQMQQFPSSAVRFCDVYHGLFRQGHAATPAPYDVSLFHHKVVLEGIRCLVSETNRTNPPPVGMPSKRDLFLALRQLRRNILQSRTLTPTDRLTALLQWHSICLDTVVSTARGTRRMCHLFGIQQNIFGGSEREETRINPARWTQSATVAAQLPLGLAYDKYVVRDLSYDLTAMRTLLRGLSLQWGVAVEMGEVVSAYIERCGHPRGPAVNCRRFYEMHTTKYDNDPVKIYAQFAQLRSKCPVAHTAENGGFYLLTRYEDVKAAASVTETFVSSVKAVIPSDPRGIRRPPLNTDPPTHTPYRTALDRTLRPKRLKRIEPMLEHHAEREFSRLVANGGGDICGDFAAIFAAWVETTWLNLEDETAPKLAEPTAAWVNAWRRQDPKETSAQSEKLYVIARKLFADRRVSPRDPEQDPASSLLQEKDSTGQPLEDELLMYWLSRQSLVVGMVAPPLLFGVMCNHLSQDKDLQANLRANPSLIPAAVEEFVRLYVPYRGFCRTPSRDIELHGRTIPAKSPITMTYAAANRDPEAFPNPDEFILNRPNITSHLCFGRGRHRCAGMPLARMALQIGLNVILRQSAEFEVNGPLEYAGMPEMGITSCPLAITPRADM